MTPGERREPRGFEPPPWERERFEELAKKRAAEVPAPDEGAVDPREEESPLDRIAALPISEPEDPDRGAGGEDQNRGAIDEAELIAMVELLRQEEPTQTSYWKAGLVAAAVLIIIGCLLVFWGVAAFVAARSAGVTAAAGATILLLFGAGFVFGGMWVAGKNLRERGVL